MVKSTTSLKSLVTRDQTNFLETSNNVDKIGLTKLREDFVVMCVVFENDIKELKKLTNVASLHYYKTSVCPAPKAQVFVGGEANFLLIFPPSFLSLFLYVFPLHLPWYVLCSLMFPNNSQ